MLHDLVYTFKCNFACSMLLMFILFQPQIYKQMSVSRTMAAVGKIRLLTSLHARYILWCQFFSLKLKIWFIKYSFCLAYAYNTCLVYIQDTFRGRVCECPVVKGVKFVGDGYTHCEGTLQGIRRFIFWQFLLLYVNRSSEL